ncbi:MAG: hypothetical protein ACLUQC_11065 [Lactococcus raffinolactis]
MAFGIGSMSPVTIKWLPGFLPLDAIAIIFFSGSTVARLVYERWRLVYLSHLMHRACKAGWLKDGSPYYYLDPAADSEMLLGYFSVNGKAIMQKPQALLLVVNG